MTNEAPFLSKNSTNLFLTCTFVQQIEIMRGETLGELEELVLLAIGSLSGNAYALTILEEIQQHTKRNLDVTAIHSVLRRLESKGFASSEMGGATADRGGRRKRFFSITVAGRKTLDDSMIARMGMYKKLLTANG